MDLKQKEWLKKEVVKWSDKNLISEYQIPDILKEYDIKYEQKKKEKPINIVKVLAIIGAILLGLGVILFVASNWQEIPREIKTLMLLAITFGTFYAGYNLKYNKKDHQVHGDALIFLSSLFYGGTTFLIAQMYNVNANTHWLVLFWAFSILPVAYLFESLSTYFLTMILFIVWDISFSITNEFANYFYPLIMFFILIPLSKKREELLYINIFGIGIAQINALINHYYWLVLLWSIGTLIYYFIEKNRLYSVLSSILFIIWNITYFFNFEKILPYYYVIPLIFFLSLSYKKKYVPEFIINLIGAWIWINLFLGRYVTVIMNKESEVIHFLLLQLSLGILFYGIGKFNEVFEKDRLFSSIYQTIAILVISIFSYILSFKVIHKELAPDIPKLFPTTSLIFIGLSVFFIFINLSRGSFKELSTKFGLVIITLVIVSTLSLIFKPGAINLNTIMFNISIFVFALLAIWYGFESKNIIFFNIGIIVFVILIISRYFDLFWELLDRSIFFMTGGVILLAGSVFLEKKRRKAIKDMKKK